LSAEHAARAGALEPIIVSEKSAIEVSDQEFAQISKILLVNRDFNLEAYKDKCIRRRIAIRVEEG